MFQELLTTKLCKQDPPTSAINQLVLQRIPNVMESGFGRRDNKRSNYNKGNKGGFNKGKLYS